MPVSQSPLIIGLGEILWDVFPDGARFGGAPANFACAAASMARPGFRVGMVSAVGDDDPGAQARQILADRNIDVSSVGCVDRPTGRVDVVFNDNGNVGYEFLADAAWDHLSWIDRLQEIAERTAAVCFGTLGQRTAASRATIREFVKSTPDSCLRILDVNLRSPFWTNEVILESLTLANVLKCNEDELPVLADILRLRGSDTEQLRALIERYELRLAVLTRGASGSLIVTRDGEISEQASPVVTVVDTVGAGDAFTAAVTIGLLQCHRLSEIHQHASQVAARACTQAGATPVISPGVGPGSNDA